MNREKKIVIHSLRTFRFGNNNLRLASRMMVALAVNREAKINNTFAKIDVHAYP